ncbi:MAG TPA: aminotransferase class V-fold PLP-dependent enzyme [Alphaproteobacteria bacterium]|jgi:cysteine desulfurase
MSQTRPIYLDNHATTPLDPRAREAMMPYMAEMFGNPHSTNHLYGFEAEEAVEYARERIAGVIGAEAREIVFTSGATESNNLAIKGAGAFQDRLEQGAKRHVVTAVTEHKCVLESVRRLERQGFRVTWLGVDGDGSIDLRELEAALTDETLLVSVMAANNEIGTLAPLAEIGALCRARDVLFHTDAAQAFGKVPLDVNAMNIDLMSISAHKVYGPKGIGALYVRRRPRVRLEPLIDGGGQERGLRSGTLPAPLCVGFGEAAAVAGQDMAAEAPRLQVLRDRLRDGLLAGLKDIHVNGPGQNGPRLPNNLNVSFAGVDAGALMADLKGLAVSSGSACSTASVEPSYVLRAVGLSDELSRASLRFGIGRFNTGAEIEAAIAQIVAAVTRLRQAAGASAAQ